MFSIIELENPAFEYKQVILPKILSKKTCSTNTELIFLLKDTTHMNVHTHAYTTKREKNIIACSRPRDLNTETFNLYQ